MTKKCNKLNIIRDKTEELYCLNCQNTLQINVPIKRKHFEPVLNLFVIHQRETNK